MKKHPNHKEMSRSALLGSQLLYEAMKALKKAKDEGNECLNLKVIHSIVEARISLDKWAKDRLPKSGETRWPHLMNFFSINYVKAGFLIKEKGSWYITSEGEDVIRHGANYIFF